MHKQHPSFFILGIARSGTTMLEEMLAAHPKIAVWSEITLGRLVWRLNLENSINEKSQSTLLLNHLLNSAKKFNPVLHNCLIQHALDEVLPLKTLEWIEILGASFLNQKKASVLGERSPENTFFIQTINQVFPDSKYIILLRNPFDVVLSICEVLEKTMNIPITDKLILKSCTYVKRGLSDLFRKDSLQGQDQLWVTYENLVRNPDQTLKKISAFLEVNYDVEMKNFGFKKRPFRDPAIENHVHPMLKNPITTGRIHRSATKFSKRQLAFIHAYLSPHLKDMPYEFPTVATRLSPLMRIRVSILKIAFFLRFHLFTESKNKMRFQVHRYAINFFNNTPAIHFFTKKLLFTKQQWEMYRQKNDLDVTKEFESDQNYLY